jgi:hypothetical protein
MFGVSEQTPGKEIMEEKIAYGILHVMKSRRTILGRTCYIIIMALWPFVGPWPLFSVS